MYLNLTHAFVIEQNSDEKNKSTKIVLTTHNTCVYYEHSASKILRCESSTVIIIIILQNVQCSFMHSVKCHTT